MQNTSSPVPLYWLKEDEEEHIMLDPRQPVIFAGQRFHAVQKFEGERFSIVFWTSQSWQYIQERERQRLVEMGAEFPSMSTLARSLATLRDYERSRSITASKRPKLKHVEDGVQSLSTRSAASTSWRTGYQTEVWQVAWVC